MKNTIVYLIRNAEQLKLKDCMKNITNSYQINNEKIILSINGEKQAELIAKSEELRDVVCLWSSDYVRAIATAKYIAFENSLSLNVDANFNERKLGNIEELKKLGKNKKYSYTVEQLLDENLTNIDGESRKDVEFRFYKSLSKILTEKQGQKIAIISHGAAIKFMLMKWCELNQDNQIIFNKKIIIEEKLELPDVIKLTFNDIKLVDIEKIKL